MISKRRFKIDKLVRDKNREYLLTQGAVSFNRVMESAEYVERLKDKLLEETQELVAAKTKDEYLVELADVLEVIHAFVSTMDIAYEQVEQERLKKREKRGGFEGRIYSSYTEVDSDNKETIDYLLRQPDKYPEIE